MGGDFLAKPYLSRCNLWGYMQANRTVCFFKLTQFFYTYQQNRYIYTLQFCFCFFCGLLLGVYSFSFCNLFFLYRQTSSSNKKMTAKVAMPFGCVVHCICNREVFSRDCPSRLRRNSGTVFQIKTGEIHLLWILKPL